MTESFRKESRKDWISNGAVPNNSDLSVGCLQRIADATELMAKRHEELIREKERAETSRNYWQTRSERLDRSLSARMGQITKLKKQLAALASIPKETT